MFVDLQTGVVTAGSAQGTDVVPASFHVGSWAGCFPGIVKMDLDTSDGVLSIPVDASTSEVECWLGRRFGPQSRVVNPDRLHVSFPGRLPDLRMRSDIVVPAGMNLTINGHGTTINVDRWQIRVPKGATLALENVVLASSTQSCALWIEGFAELTEVHFQNCTVEGLVVLQEFSSLAFDGGAYVWSAGGAVHIWADGAFSMTASSVRDCVAQNGRADCGAGAILIGKRAVVSIVDSLFENNSAVCSRPLANAIGGAIRLQKSAVMTMRGCMLLSNKVVLTASEAATLGPIAALAELGTARTGQSFALAMGGAVAVWTTAIARLSGCTLRDNAAERSDAPQGGAVFLWTRAELEMENCLVEGNSARAGAVTSKGGGIAAVGPLSTMILIGTTFLGNVAGDGASDGWGGAIFMIGGIGNDGANGRAVGCNFHENRVDGRSSVGAAIWLGSGATLQIADSGFVRNVATGRGPIQGGALWTGGAATVENTTFIGNSVTASKADAKGGAVYVAGGRANLVGCHMFGNRAMIIGAGTVSDGGAAFVDENAHLVLAACELHTNSAGGSGVLQIAGAGQATGAMHISSSGALTLGMCTIVSSLLEDKDSGVWVIVNSGMTRLNASFFEAAAPGQELLRLQRSNTSEVEIRGCKVKNLGMSSSAGRRLGIVNSTFMPWLTPELNATTAMVHADKRRCGVQIFNQNLCDPRAVCIEQPSGGVRCSCDGRYLSDRPGSFPDGQNCLEETHAEMTIQSRVAYVEATKPSRDESKSVLVVQVRGESALSLSFNMLMTRTSSSPDGGSFWSRNWSVLDEQQVALHGHSLIWDVPPLADADLDLDASAGKLSDSNEYSFRLRVDCNGTQPCVEDGDTIETVISIDSASSPSSRTFSEVRILTRVQSLLSCAHTKVQIKPDWGSVPLSSSIRVRLLAYDVDNIQMRFTRADLLVSFGNRTIPFQWSRGSNEYIADVLAAELGVYGLVVIANNAWNGSASWASRCELLQTWISVHELTPDTSTTWILVGAGSAAVVLVGGLVVVVRKRHAHLQAIMAMLFSEVPPCDEPHAHLVCVLDACSPPSHKAPIVHAYLFTGR
jgi:hypothetical protein